MNGKNNGVMALALVLLAGSAWAWGPRADVAIVSTAAQVITQDGVVPLTKLDKDIRAGASASSELMDALYPTAKIEPFGAIEAEIFLLKSVRGKRIDPYLAFRLGALGKLVASQTAPLANANPTYRNLFYSDVENNIQTATLKPSKRALVDSVAYLQSKQREAQINDDIIVHDYQSGRGYEGVAKASLSQDASRSVSAVIDVWNTILGANSIAANVSGEQTRDYMIAALDYYVRRGNADETKRAYDRLMEAGTQSPDLRKRVGDLFYDAKQYDQAMVEYEAVLAASPGRKDVVQRITEYYSQLGDAATQENRLEDALTAYSKASQVDPFSTQAQSLRIDAEKRIAERDARLGEVQQTLSRAVDLENSAAQEEGANNLPAAMRLLHEAEAEYGSVSDEFQTERLAKIAGLRNVSAKLQDLRQKLGSSTQQLSGSGFDSDVHYLASAAAREADEKTLRSLVAEEYRVQSKRLQEELLK